MTLEDFALKVSGAWSKNTSYTPNDWTVENPAKGQCAIIALLVQEIFGGDIVKCDVVGDKDSHFFNHINGQEVDMTISQFPESVEFINHRTVNREEIIKHPGTAERYDLLKNEFSK